jgi:DNA-binding Xre family transcriptional regulator
MSLRFNLNRYLTEHQLGAYNLVQATKNRIATATVYQLARKPAQRIDLDTIDTIMQALETLTGETVKLEDLLERTEQSINPNYTNLINQKPALSWQAWQQLAGEFSKKELEEDEVYWKEIKREKQLELQREKPIKKRIAK